jgi:hypothetical protein
MSFKQIPLNFEIQIPRNGIPIESKVLELTFQM